MAKRSAGTSAKPPTAHPTSDARRIGMPLPWYESTLLWSCIAIVVGIIAGVVIAMTKEFRWLLFFTFPFGCLAFWSFFRAVINQQRAAWLCIIGCSILFLGGLDWLSKALQPSSAQPKNESDTRPPIREKVEEITVRIGTTSATVPISQLRTTGYAPFVLGDLIPVKIYEDAGHTFTDVAIYGGPGRPTLELKKNEFVDRTPSGWDRNFSDAAIEVVNEDSVPMFQLIYETPSRIRVAGILPFTKGIVVISNDGIMINPTAAVKPLQPIFKYPSWQFLHQYAIAPQAPLKIETSQDLKFVNVGDAKVNNDTGVFIVATVTNNGDPVTVGDYSLDIVARRGVKIHTRPLPRFPDSITLTSPDGGQARGDSAALATRTAIIPIPKGGSRTGVLVFLTEVPQSQAMRKGNILLLHYKDMTGAQHTATHKVGMLTPSKPGM
jgi:hypothetical protein